jgi:hypothetical protein
VNIERIFEATHMATDLENKKADELIKGPYATISE